MARVLNFDTRIKTKRDTAANWEKQDPVLLNGEEIIVDTNAGEVRKKIGDGVKTYTQLPFTDETLRNLITAKVDKVDGKGLSTNDFTNTLLSKLNGIEEGANKYTHPSNHPASIITQDSTHRFVTDTEKSTWNNKASTAVATVIANGLMSKEDKVKLDSIPDDAVFTDTVYTHPDTHPATMIVEDSTHRFVTDTEKSTWNAKASTAIATTSANGLMSKEDKVKLNGIATGANNYTHPSTHDASIITQNSTHRFVTDTEKSTWNAKASTAIATTSANGLMSSTDKTKLDGIEAGANKTTVDSALSSTSTNPVQNKVINTALAGKANSSHTHTPSEVGADPSGSANTALTNAKAYTDKQISSLINGAPSTLDTLGEIAQAMQDNQDVVEALEASIGTKANSSDLTAHTSNTTIHITSTERTNWNAAKTHADSAHAPSNAQPNQNAFSNVLVGTTTVAADTTTDTLTLAGSNVTLTPDATNDTITIGITKANVTSALGYTPPTTNTTYGVATTSANGLMSSTDKTKLDGIATGANKYSHPTYTSKTAGLYKITVDGTGHVSAATAVAKADITGLGIPAQDTTYSVATTSANGLMSSTDKTNLTSLLSRVSTLETNYEAMLAKLKTAVFISTD